MGRDMVVSRYAIPIGIRALTGCQGDPRNGASQLGMRAYIYKYLGLGGHGFRKYGYRTKLRL